MEVRSYSYQPIDSRMYIMAVGKTAVIIDPCESEAAKDYLEQCGIEVVKVLLTHEHYDHISGVNWLRSLYPTTVICTEACGKGIENPSKNLSRHYEVLFIFSPEQVRQFAFAQNVQPYECKADIVFDSIYTLEVGGHKWVMTATPGHSPGSCCIMLDDQYCFTGDSMLEHLPIITRFPGGSRKAFEKSVESYLSQLNEGTIICPGHGDMYTVKKKGIIDE